MADPHDDGPDKAAVTALLAEVDAGNVEALNRLIPLVYDELRRIAHAQLRRERQDHTLNTTALVHEAYLRLVDQTRVHWRDRAHFFGVAALAMRRILVNYAEARRAAKRGGGATPVPLDEALLVLDDRPGALPHHLSDPAGAGCTVDYPGIIVGSTCPTGPASGGRHEVPCRAARSGTTADRRPGPPTQPTPLAVFGGTAVRRDGPGGVPYR